ncbi:serendipity locus protein alpha-like isoform X1 [Teleopsis dalmanni]|uniref:serendipity locus protein alpha-like isoform X1 n=1 Tax=Teleopsis dalmanni TaxID=139649 RepID=UPI0018CFDAFF|nr:serendipity locus protein alpha-like isoform X1 [Teleopsis dalmanni]
MNSITEKFMPQMAKCRKLLNLGYTSTKNSGIAWLNKLCAEFLEFSNNLHHFITKEIEKDFIEASEDFEIIFLCLTQIITCIKHLERTIKAEEVSGSAISASRQLFLDRIYWCLDRLLESMKNLVSCDTFNYKTIEEQSFIELMDLVFDSLLPYSTYNESTNYNNAEQNAEAMFDSKKVRSMIDLILSHTLAFANVALKEDKKAISALCQKVLRECISFQDECALTKPVLKINDSNRSLRATSLENALYQLEGYVNEALLRLVYVCFLDFNKFSIQTLRTEILIRETDDPVLDELIADFDVNVDRMTQIGIFAITFATNSKMKTIIRSCLASIESLDSCVIPSLYAKNAADIHSEILEQHFNEEVNIFKNAIQQIIDSHAFTSCYADLLSDCIKKLEKDFNKTKACEIIQMAELLYEHFQLPANRKELAKIADRDKYFKKFVIILRECQAILICADQVESKRILKRFRILSSISRKFLDTLVAHGRHAKKTNAFIMSEQFNESECMFESAGISPSIPSILYQNDHTLRRRAASDSLKGNYSKLMHTPKPLPLVLQKPKHDAELQKITNTSVSNIGGNERRCSVRRKPSLRTAMFKRQKSTETEKVYHIYKNNSASLQISDILDQLCSMSSNMASNLKKSNSK